MHVKNVKHVKTNVKNVEKQEITFFYTFPNLK